MIDEMLTFLARAPTLGDLSLTWGQAGPRLGTGGVYLRGVKVLQTKTDLLGCQKQRCRAEFLLRLCLPLPAGDTDTALQNARRLAALQAWVAAESAAGRAPRLGNCEPPHRAGPHRGRPAGPRRPGRHRAVQHPRDGRVHHAV